MKRFETFEHTADIGIDAFGSTLSELFEAAAEGLLWVIGPEDGVRAAWRREVSLSADDLGELLITWLSEIHYIGETEHALFASARVLELDGSSCRMRAELQGEAYDPTRHEAPVELKAVTYHDLEVRCVEDGPEGEAGWRAQVVLDV